jgi:hypothetical protein
VRKVSLRLAPQLAHALLRLAAMRILLTVGFVHLAACTTVVGNSPSAGDASTAPIDGSGHGGSNNPGMPPPAGVYAVPLSTATGSDQGSFWGPMLSASGKQFLLQVDTGSTVTGIAGSSCATCTGISPLYSPGGGANDTGKTDSAQYADMSGWSGEVYSDTVGLGHGSPNVSLDLVDITQESTSPAFFSGNEDQGILGVGPDALLDPGTTSYFTQVAGAGTPAIMAFEFCETTGTMWLGGYDASHAQGAVHYTPILTTGTNSNFYSVSMTGMTLDGTSLGTAQTFDGPVVDTGTSLFIIPTSSETALLSKVNANSGFQALFPGQTLSDSGDGCITAASGTTAAMIDAQLPPLEMTFAGENNTPFTLTVPAMKSYLYDGGSGQFCLAVVGGGDNGGMTMGDTIMRAFVTVIDVANHKVGFAPTIACAAPAPYVAYHRIREHGHGPHRGRRFAD